jgi:hypothetical protein
MRGKSAYMVGLGIGAIGGKADLNQQAIPVITVENDPNRTSIPKRSNRIEAVVVIGGFNRQGH